MEYLQDVDSGEILHDNAHAGLEDVDSRGAYLFGGVEHIEFFFGEVIYELGKMTT